MNLIYRLRELCPDPGELVALEAEELAGLLLTAINRLGHPKISRHDLLLSLQTGAIPFSGAPLGPIEQALSEAWAWLEHNLIVVPFANQQHWYALSKKGKLLNSPESFTSFREAAAFPRSLLHESVDREAWVSFSRGRFDTAVFEAFREVEITVREAAGFPQHEHGVAMIRRAFRKDGGPLTDMTVDDAEREATSNLFAGAIGSYKNPVSHRRIGRVDASEAGELLILASHLLRIVDDRRHALAIIQTSAGGGGSAAASSAS